MERAGVAGDPSRDQYFLVDERVLDRIPTHATGAGFDLGHVLEIGPGTGGLTARLLAHADRVTAIERDPDLGNFLEREFADAVSADRLTVIVGDALEVELPAFSSVIANLPYGISSPILFRLLPARKPLLVMVQREFGERMAAEPGTDDYGRPSVSSQHFASVELVEPVPPTAFEPQPPVDSVLVRTQPRTPDYDVPDDELFLDCVAALFTQRRKTVRNAIRNTTHLSGIAAPDRVVDALDEELLGRRPGDLTPAEFAAISRVAADVGMSS